MKSIGGVLLLAFIGLASACFDVRRDCYLVTHFCKYDTWARGNCARTCNKCGGPNTPRPNTPRPNTQAPGQCGVAYAQQGRVVSGTTARRGAWPWQALMVYNGRPGCGGTLVAPNWVVTAAHCVSGKERNTGAFKIVMGEHSRSLREGSEQSMRVSGIYTHPGWNRRTFTNDLAMIKLSRPAQIDKYVSTACLPSSPIPAGSDCYITGWGRTMNRGQMSDVLQQGKLPSVDARTCERLNRRTINHPITSSMQCGGNPRGLTSGCQGDSGGPYVCKRGSRWEVFGAVSHGSGDCNAFKTYTVFANIANLRSWIDQTMRR